MMSSKKWYTTSLSRNFCCLYVYLVVCLFVVVYLSEVLKALPGALCVAQDPLSHSLHLTHLHQTVMGTLLFLGLFRWKRNKEIKRYDARLQNGMQELGVKY